MITGLDFVRPSSVGTWLMCQMKWKFSIIDRYPRGQSGAALIGTAVHAGIEANYKQKVETRTNISVELATEFAMDAFAKKEKRVKWGLEPKDAKGSRKQVEDIIKHYIEVHAPVIQPKFIEKGIEFSIGSTKVKGTLDLIDDNDTLIDHKTSKNKPSSIGADYMLQATLYKMGAEAAKIPIHKIRVDYIVKTKKPYVLPLFVEKEAVKTVTRIVEDMTKISNLEMYTPNPNGWWCSKKWCDFHPENNGPCPYGL